MYVGVYVCTCVYERVCMHNIIPCFKIKIVCICVQSSTKIIVEHIEIDALVIIDTWYL
jgi:hypothetical protein